MNQLNLLEPEPLPQSETTPWILIDSFLPFFEACKLLNYSKKLDWKQNTIRMFGKPIQLPRLEAIYGQGNYTYSGVMLEANPWIPALAMLRKDIEAVAQCKFAIAIGNYYRDGRDHIGYHSDDSPEMGDPSAVTIASLSLGATRKFQLRNNETRAVHTFELQHGSLLIMLPGCQKNYKHRLCKAKDCIEERINWTFRPLISIH